MGYKYGGADEKPALGRPRRPDDPDACGTERGVRQHRRHGMEQCQPCKDANTAKANAYNRRKAA